MVTEDRPDDVQTPVPDLASEPTDGTMPTPAELEAPGDPMTTTSLAPDPTPTRPPVTRHPDVAASAAEAAPVGEPIIRVVDVSFYYGTFRAVKDITIDMPTNRITALIGPSGCGKSTLLRTFNRMNDLIPGTKVTGLIEYAGQNLYDSGIDPVEVRRRIGMVFQKPNPFPKSIYDNVAFGPRLNGYKGNMDELVEGSLRKAAIWDEVKDKLKQSGMSLSGGQQQRLCIARAIATEPDVILMDEPCSALDPRSTLQIEELMMDLRKNYTIIIVTHNMQQAARASDRTVFLNMAEDRAGYVVEQGDTLEIFTNPKDQMTEDYVSGRFG
jgi:phosphate transport system ATP-binding protein